MGNLRAGSKSPSLSSCSSSLSYENNDKISQDEELKDIEEFNSEFYDDSFLNELIRIQEDSEERQQKHLKDNGLIKRFLHLNQLEQTCEDNTAEYSIEDKTLFRQSMLDLIDIECKSIITWARQIPGFEKLKIEDQTFIIEQNFLEVIVIDYIWKTVQKNQKNVFVLNDYLMLSRTVCKKMDLLDTFDHLVSVVTQLQYFGISRNEYMCLKVLALFKSYCGFNSSDNIMRLRESCFVTLKKATKDAYFNRQAADDFRYDSYLILLSDIKTLSMRLMTSLLAFSKDNSIRLPNLLSDMCISQRTFRSNIMQDMFGERQ